MSDKFKLVISDCHLGAGRFVDHRLNPHEDFAWDGEMIQFLRHFSTGDFGAGKEVELIINGDFLDFLNVSDRGEFEEVITEDLALRKLQKIFEGHRAVMEALREFAAQPGKSVVYLIGNHDAELFFPKVRDAIVERWGPRVKVVADRDRLIYEDWGVEVHHGNQFEASNELDFHEPFYPVTGGKHAGSQALKLPWGSFYVLKIVNRLRWEREHIDRVRPVPVAVLLGLLFDPWFTIRFAFLSAFYFVRARLLAPGLSRRRTVRQIFDRWKIESQVFQDLEGPARQILDQRPGIHTVIFGHTHRPMQRVYPDGKQYLNTGTWAKYVNLDWRTMGSHALKTFAVLRLAEGAAAQAELRQWVGESGPHKAFMG